MAISAVAKIALKLIPFRGRPVLNSLFPGLPGMEWTAWSRSSLLVTTSA
jgi:hypothetical protein